MTSIKTFEDACLAVGTSAAEFDAAFAQLPERFRKSAAHEKLAIVVEALNEGWTPDWSNNDEPKYYPWWDMEDGVSLLIVHYHCRCSLVSSRLCFKSRQLAEYAAKQFIDIYREYLKG